MTSPSSRSTPAEASYQRFSASMLPPEADPAEKELVRLLERALSPSFTLVKRLGAGGMGSVYLARDPVLKRLVAVKVMAPALAEDTSARVRFEREAQSVAALSHPNVVAVYSVGELENGVPYLVMQYVEGRSMAERIATDGALDAATARRVLGDVAAALAAAHRKGIVHRDIKPANILWDDDAGRALVTDFGIAAVLERPEDGREATRITHTGMVVGTPAYMSPEQLLEEPLTDKTDIYSLGLLGYELLIADSPYRISSPREVMAAHLRDTPRRLSTMRADVDAEVERLLEACLSKDPAERPSAAEVERRLAHGASVLLEWPPPGLEGLRERFTGATRLLAVGSVVVGVPVVLKAVFDTDSMTRSLLPSDPIMVPVTSIGLLVFLAGCLAFIGFLRAAGRAVQGGYRWGTIAEAVADDRGDTGALIAGGREYAALTPPQRTTFRRLRVLGAALLLAAAVTPVVGFAAGVAVAARFAAGPVVVLWSSLVLATTLMTVWALLVSNETRVLREPRRKRRALAGLRERPANLAESWTAAFERVRAGQRMGAGPAGRVRLVVSAAVTVAVIALGTALIANALLAVAAGFTVTSSSGLPSFEGVRAIVRRADRLSAYLVPTDRQVSALRAGQALHSISRAGGLPPVNRWERAPAAAIPALQFPSGASPFGPGSPTGIVEALRQAPRGFTDTQRFWLRRFADNPSLPEFRLLATAPALDLGAAVWDVPPGSEVRWQDLPTVRFQGLRHASWANLAYAALDLAAGEATYAERRIREVMSVGALMVRESRLAAEMGVGASLMTSASEALHTLYEVTGRRDEARALSRAFDERPESPRADTPPPRDAAELRRVVVRTVLDTLEHPSIRWEVLLGTYALQPCRDLRQLVFGADSSFRASMDLARVQLVRRGSDSLLFAFAERTLDDPRMLRNGEPLIARPSSRLVRAYSAVTGHRTLEGCAPMIARRK